MMRNKLLTGLLLTALAAFGADAAGKWKTTMPGRDGATIDIEYNFKADGEKLTGTLSAGAMGEFPISEGSIKGDDVAFTVAPNENMKVVHKGKVTGDEMKLVADFGQRQMEVVAKRVK
jgi:hypothetical protein